MSASAHLFISFWSPLRESLMAVYPLYADSKHPMTSVAVIDHGLSRMFKAYRMHDQRLSASANAVEHMI
jgi:hypothetical protein